MEIVLITSRETHRWVIPKGWPILGRKAHQVATIEAYQGAGNKGVMRKTQIGTYGYESIPSDGGERLCLVIVFPLRVTPEAVELREIDGR